MHSKTTNQTCTVPYVTSSNLLILAFKDLVVLQALYNLKQTIAFSSINLTDYIAFQTIHYILACPCERLQHQESAFGVQLRIRMCIVIGLHYGLPAFNKFIFLGCYLCLSLSLRFVTPYKRNSQDFPDSLFIEFQLRISCQTLQIREKVLKNSNKYEFKEKYLCT